MEYRDFLVHVPLVDFDMQIEIAVALAKRFGAHLAGICGLPEAAVVKDAMLSPFIHLQESAEVKNVMARERAEAQRAERQFRAAAAREGISHSWMAAPGDPSDLMLAACQLEDLTIVEQCREGGELIWGPAVLVALSGHPVLIVPRSWRTSVSAQRAIVAWDASLHAAAAVRHALPLLARAAQVTILVGTSGESRPSFRRAAPFDIVGYLRRHGIDAVVSELNAPKAGTGAIILKVAEDSGADLIVMGAYGRSRFREWLLSGTTRYVLEHMAVPVFTVH